MSILKDSLFSEHGSSAHGYSVIEVLFAILVLGMITVAILTCIQSSMSLPWHHPTDDRPTHRMRAY